jgi:parvulin-like peptidyl-prolyl isomerase
MAQEVGRSGGAGRARGRVALRVCALAAVGLVGFASTVRAQDAGVAEGGAGVAVTPDGAGVDAGAEATPRNASGDTDVESIRRNASGGAETPVVRAGPMLAVGPQVPEAEVHAQAAAPARAIATVRGERGRARVARLTAGELAAEIERRAAPLRAAYVDPARVEELSAALVRERVLAEAALQAGLLQAPDVAREVERLLARALLDRALAANPPPVLDDATAQAFYDAHLADYTKPAQVRVFAIVLATRDEAWRVLHEAGNLRQRRFEAFAKRRSIDAPSRRRGGSLGWMSAGSRPEPGLVEAALALSPGETRGEPLEIEGRFYVLRVVERRAPEIVPLARARASIASRLRAEHEQRVADVVYARAAREQDVRIEPVADAVRVAP